MPRDQQPDVVLTSPYRRALQTATLIHGAGGVRVHPADFIHDERLREKEFGVLDRLTRYGIEQHHPDQAELRRSSASSITVRPAGRAGATSSCACAAHWTPFRCIMTATRVLIVAHQVVVLCLRYLLERMTEDQILRIDAEGDVANCAVTEYAFDQRQGHAGRHGAAGLQLRRAAAGTGAPVTAEPDAPVGAR